MIRFLKKLMGDDLVFMTYETAQSKPGHPGISLHTDGQPCGAGLLAGSVDLRVDVSAHTSPFPRHGRSPARTRLEPNPSTRSD